MTGIITSWCWRKTGGKIMKSVSKILILTILWLATALPASAQTAELPPVERLVPSTETVTLYVPNDYAFVIFPSVWSVGAPIWTSGTAISGRQQYMEVPVNLADLFVAGSIGGPHRISAKPMYDTFLSDPDICIVGADGCLGMEASVFVPFVTR